MPLTFENSVFADTYRYEGEVLGIKKGEVIGIEKGIKKVAIELIKESFDNLLISKTTALDFEQINLLRNELKQNL